MKKSLIATLVASSMLSPLAFAAEPMVLSTAQMDSVTAGNNPNTRETNINVVGTILQYVNQRAIAVNFGNGSATAVAVASQSVDIRQN